MSQRAVYTPHSSLKVEPPLACWPAENPSSITRSDLAQTTTDRYCTKVALIPRVHVRGKSPCPGDFTLRRPPSMVLGSLHLGLIRRRRTQEGYGTHAVAGVRKLPGCSYGLAGQQRSRGCSRSALAAWHRAPTEMTLWAAGACEWRPTTWGGVDGRVCSADLIREADRSHSTVLRSTGAAPSRRQLAVSSRSDLDPPRVRS